MKKPTIILIVIVSIIVPLISCLPWIALLIGTLNLPDPPAPEITYGEFPVKITYEVNGEIKVIEDVIICEFDGFKTFGTAGRRRTWKDSLKSGNKSIVLLSGKTTDSSFEITESVTGLPEYFMGDFDQSKEDYANILADDRYLGYTQWKNGKQKGDAVSITKEEVWKKYKLRVISIEYSEPIKNTFK